MGSASAAAGVEAGVSIAIAPPRGMRTAHPGPGGPGKSIALTSLLFATQMKPCRSLRPRYAALGMEAPARRSNVDASRRFRMRF
jgi:hypothetical protein